MNITTNNQFDSNDRIFDLAELVEALLPHGSGIDGKWQIQQDKSGNIYCFNTYTCYTYGMIDSYADFYVKIKLVNLELHVIDLCFFGRRSQYLNEKHQIREYLESIFFDADVMQGIAITNNAKIDITRYL